MDAHSFKQHKGIHYTGITTCFICHDGNGSIFMAKRSQKARDEQGKWDVGGGGLEWGVTAADNVRKEIEEEYAATPLSVEFLGYRDVFRALSDGVPTHWLALDFIAHVNPDDVRINEPEKFDDSGWFMLGDLPTPLYAQNEHMLGRYKKTLARKLKEPE